jgi:hypothetical protein
MDRTRDRALPESRWHGTIPRRRLDPMAVPGIGPLRWERVQGDALRPKEGCFKPIAKVGVRPKRS